MGSNTTNAAATCADVDGCAGVDCGTGASCADTLCDVKRDLAVPIRRDISIAHAFISSGEETTDLFCLLSARTSSNMLYSKRALYLHFSAIRPEASMFDDG